MYDIYHYKQPQGSTASSPDTNMGMTASPMLEQGITAKQGIGIAAVTAKVIPAGKQVFNMYIDATGNSRMQRNINRVQEAVGYGVIAFTAGPLAALGAFAIKTTVDMIRVDIENTKNTINSEYNRQKRGAAINNFTASGGYYD